MRHERDGLGRLTGTWESAPGTVERRTLRRSFSGPDPRPDLIARPSVNPDGEHVVRTLRDEAGLPTAIVETGFAPLGPSVADGFAPIERTTRFEHDAAGLPVSLDGPRDDVVGEPPGLGLDYDGHVAGYFDQEYMPEAGVEPFERGLAYWVETEGLTYFDVVMYSREELCGWLTLALIDLDAQSLDVCRFLPLMERLWLPRSCLDALRLKLEGGEVWSRGPVGPKFTEADLARWHGSHVPGFSERYFGT